MALQVSQYQQSVLGMSVRPTQLRWNPFLHSPSQQSNSPPSLQIPQTSSSGSGKMPVFFFLKLCVLIAHNEFVASVDYLPKTIRFIFFCNSSSNPAALCHICEDLTLYVLAFFQICSKSAIKSMGCL